MAITGIKGFNDILPGEVEKWQHIERTARRVFKLYGLSEIRTPILEKTELFKRSIGDATDIVEKEMYSFEDKGRNPVTMRPEGTASVMRAYIEHKMHALDPIARLYYMGPMFRYERPQKGRYRQFHQIGAEITGVTAPTVDAQVLTMLTHFFQELGLTEPSLQINSLGCPECRPLYREALKSFLLERIELLCEDCNRRYQTNPLRALDCKSAGCQEATKGAPSMLQYLCTGCYDHFEKTRSYLDLAGTPYTINERMVRGLDYYTRTTFEMVTTMLGSQSAVAAGGRYDGLISELGGPQIPGIGFAMGVERVALLLAEKEFARRPDLFIAAIGEKAHTEAFRLMTALQGKGAAVEFDYEGKSLKSQMRRADKFNSRFTLIIGEDELAKGTAPLKDMDGGTQSDVALDAAVILKEITSPSPSRESQLKEAWRILVERASVRRPIFHGELAAKVGVLAPNVKNLLKSIQQLCEQNNLPPLHALAVITKTNLPGAGLFPGMTPEEYQDLLEWVCNHRWSLELPQSPLV